jgi:hypothetical protein
MIVRRVTHRGRLVSLLLAFAALTALSVPVAADQAAHTTHVPFTPVGDAPLRSGAAVVIHANGPTVYSRELFTLNGAVPDATLLVVLFIHVDNLACQGTPAFVLPVAVLETNRAGNATADIAFGPEVSEALGLRGTTVSARWGVSLDGIVLYQSNCITASLD